ncbi:cold-shock protein [Pseudonocardia sp. MH-G8]|nr:cold shock domain-containing protein [Pseudonocardia sp. MH-G8]OZM77693.1 cold-shock protein [Pseudonocardia sp. MH-G8]
MVRGVVREWHRDDGWGVIESPETPGGCWVLYSHIDMRSPAELAVGQQVEFTFEQVTSQDGYRWRAITVLPDGPVSSSDRHEVPDGRGAFRSSLRIEFDESDSKNSGPGR